MTAPKASAADRSWGNIEVAKKAIENVAPIISDVDQDQTAASLVFAPENFIQKPLVVETQITPDPKPVVKSKKAVRSAVSFLIPAVSGNHFFPYGYCTYYVSQKRSIPWSGNAAQWLSGARSYGFTTGSTPQPSAIMVTSEGGRVGHVAYVEAVNDSEVTISEMNYRGFGIISSRTISAGSSVIRGYIY